MPSKFFKIVFRTPAFKAGVFILSFFLLNSVQAQEEQIKPNIKNLTSDGSAKKTNEIGSSEPRVPNSINKHSLGLGIGQTFLRSDYGDNGNDKITPDIYYNYSASHSFDFMANAHWSKHKFLNRNTTIRGLALSVKGKGYQFDSFSPFALGGFGFYLPESTRIVGGVPTETRSQLVFGMNLGIGFELRLNSEVTVGVIAHYHDPFSVRQEIGPELDGSYMKLLLLGMYTFN